MRRSLRTLLIINYVTIALIVAGFIYLINQTNERNDEQSTFNKFFVSKYNQPRSPLEDVRDLKAKQVVLSKGDIEKINSHLDFLSDKVTSEIDRARQNTQYDLDRVNTFLTFGIGILAIIGALLPLFFNSSLAGQISDLVNQVDGISRDVESSSQQAANASETAQTASSKLSHLTTNLDVLENKMNETNARFESTQSEVKVLSEEVVNARELLPYLNALILQNAISRFLNIGIARLKEPDRNDFFKSAFEGLIIGFNVFEKINYSELKAGQKQAFNSSIEDFHIGVQNLLTNTLVNSRRDFLFIGQLNTSLVKLKKNIDEDFNSSIKEIIHEITSLKHNLR